jgi:hypothetical protein
MDLVEPLPISVETVVAAPNMVIVTALAAASSGSTFYFLR